MADRELRHMRRTELVEIIFALKQSEDQLKAENADRKTVYAYIAKKENVSVDVVASQRAAKLAQIAKSGEYIQKNGKWVRK